MLYIFLNLTASDGRTAADSKNVVERDLIADQHMDLYRRANINERTAHGWNKRLGCIIEFK